MFVNIAIGAIIFGYAAYTLVKFIKKGKQGKCASCEINKSCSTKTCDINWDEVVDKARNNSENKN